MATPNSTTRAELQALANNGFLTILFDGVGRDVSLKDLQRFFGAARDVTNNTAKLALLAAEMNPGQIVRVVASSNRLELWNGGDPTQETSWKVLG